MQRRYKVGGQEPWGNPGRPDPLGAVRASLVASGERGVTPNYELTQGGPADFLFVTSAMEAGFREMSYSTWPTESDALPDDEHAPGRCLFRDTRQAVYALQDGTLALLSVGHGWASCRTAAGDRAAVVAGIGVFQGLYPAAYMEAREDRVPITFWTHGPNGPERRLRMIDSAPWSAVEGNYPAETRAEVDHLMHDFRPGDSGQLILWQGPPGTGKTWALRALASEWLPWAEFHYITDPDAFFVDRPSYMIDVLLSETYEVFDFSGDVVTEADEQAKWKLLILEDTGELLSANAKEKYGQGLSRLLNVVDGMIGQGLRVLCLVTTNDELGELNPAVRRPGRCASQIVFPPFSAEEATVWLGKTVEDAATVAELYARRGDATDALTASTGPDEGAHGHTVEASLTEMARGAGVIQQIRRVAAAHQDEAIGYGETAWNPDTKTVLWIHGDWTDHEAARADFLAIDGVEGFDCEAEAIPDGWFDAQVVYPDDPPKWVTEPPEERENALQEALRLARLPLLPDTERPVPPERYVTVAPAPTSERDVVIEKALDALVAFAGRNEQAPTFHLHMPATSLGVDVRTPAVTVEAAPAPEVHNHVTAASPPPPDVHVHVPDSPAPQIDVHNHVEPAAVTVEAPNVEVTVQRPAPRAIRVETNEYGERVFVPEEVEA